MNNNKPCFRVLIIVFTGFFFTIFPCINVLGLGVTPGRTIISEPGFHEKNISVWHDKQVSMDYSIGVSGDLEEYIFPQNETVSIFPGETKKIYYNVDLPADFEGMSPGTNKGEIRVAEVIDEEDGGSVGGSLAVISQVYVEVPYPEKYAEGELVIQADAKGATLFLKVNNKGNCDLKDVQAKVEIYAPEEGMIDSFTTKQIDVAVGNRKEIISKWDANIRSVEYKAEADIIYGDETDEIITLSKTFPGGWVEGDINIERKEGEVICSIPVTSKGVSDLKDVQAKVEIYTPEEGIIDSFISEEIELPNGQTETFVFGWAPGIASEKYQVRADIDFSWDKSAWNRSDTVQLSTTVEPLWLTLTVESAHGGSQPGTVTADYGTELEQWVANSPVAAGVGTQHVCRAAQAVGNDFTQVSPTNITMTLTNDAEVVWQWTTNFWLNTDSGEHGTVNPADQWVDSGSNVELLTTPEKYYHFEKWVGPGTNTLVVGDCFTSATTIVVVDPASITATFAENKAANEAPEWWLAKFGWTNKFDEAALDDFDGDGAPNWAEYAAGTDPKDEDSVFQFKHVMPPNSNGIDIRWPSVSNRVYTVHRSTNLIRGFTVIATNLTATPPENIYIDEEEEIKTRYYKIEVEKQ